MRFVIYEPYNNLQQIFLNCKEKPYISHLNRRKHMFTAVLCGFQINTKLTGHFRITKRVNLLNSIAVQKMKLLAVVLVTALR